MNFAKLQANFPERDAAYPADLPPPNKADLDYIIDKYDCKYPQSFIEFQLKECKKTPMGDFAFEGFGWANRTLDSYLNLEEVVKDFRELDFPDYLSPFRSENGDFWCFDTRKQGEDSEYPVVIWDHNSNSIEENPEFQWETFIDWLDRTMEEDE